jgi:hypothetical protein
VSPWSAAQIEATLGNVDAELGSTVEVGLRDIDRLLRGVTSTLHCGLEYSTRGPSPGGEWKGLEASLDAPRTIDNDDGSTSVGSIGAEVAIERLQSGNSRWLVTARVGQNCNRRGCPEDPHVLFRDEAEVESATEAVSRALSMTSQLVDHLRSRTRDELGYFIHG